MWMNASKIPATESALISQALTNASVTLDTNYEMGVAKVA